MIFFSAINDINSDGKFHQSVVVPSYLNKEIKWGITELSSTIFSKIKKDDFIFFYHKGKIIGIGKVLNTFIDKELSRKLWGINIHKLKGQLYWSNIILFSTYNSVEFDFHEIIKLGNYSGNFSVRRIIGLNSQGLLNIQKEHGTQDEYVKYILNNFSKIEQKA